MARLFEGLANVIKGTVICEWLRRPNKQFDGSTPLQMIERGETDRLWRMIWQLREATLDHQIAHRAALDAAVPRETVLPLNPAQTPSLPKSLWW